jgi:subtilisin family serine protease
VVPTHVYTKVFQGFAGELPAGAARSAEQQRGVLRIWPDLPVRAEAQKLPTGIDRINADENPWADINRDGGRIDADVAVLDSGIAKHRELSIAGGKACVGSDYKDGHGHGTHVAGTIAAKDNSRGVVGIAPGARLWAVKVLDNSGSGRISEVICGLDWVYNHRDTIDVVNMSLSAPAEPEDQNTCEGGDTTPLHEAICQVVDGGVTVVVAAGNQSTDASTRAPATYDEVITVSAFADFDGKPGGQGVTSCANDDDDTFAGLSNDGEDIDVAAPGMCIRSTWRGGKYKSLNGTSMATAHVTGAAALYMANNPGNKQPDAVRNWLLGDASQPQTSEYGFEGDTDGSRDPVLYLPSQ